VARAWWLETAPVLKWPRGIGLRRDHAPNLLVSGLKIVPRPERDGCQG
jgi:hypothetical protein